MLCLLGHSGCGKSTLLRLAAGLERPAAGRIVMDRREVAGPTRFVPPEKRGVGLMFQDYALFPHMTILANVMFGLTSLDRASGETAARAALARVGLEDYAEDYPHALSGGEQQRVALARAIVPRPSVLLMDEPFSGLDKRLRDSVRDETLAVLRETRATAVVVTHDPEEAMRMADRIALLRKGRLVQVDRPEALYARPADLMAARFFSELNEFEGVAKGGDVETPFGRFPAPGHGDGARLVVCIRQSGLLLHPPGAGVLGRLIRSRFPRRGLARRHRRGRSRPAAEGAGARRGGASAGIGRVGDGRSTRPARLRALNTHMGTEGRGGRAMLRCPPQSCKSAARIGPGAVRGGHGGKALGARHTNPRGE